MLLVPFIITCSFELLIKIGSLFLTILAIRSITIVTTILPKTTSRCSSNHILNGHCYDFIFSGHFSLGLLTSLVLLENGKINQLFFFLFNILHGLLIVATRSHYTIDVLVGGLVTFIVYQNNLRVI